jgi:hypothetical protein
MNQMIAGDPVIGISGSSFEIRYDGNCRIEANTGILEKRLWRHFSATETPGGYLVKVNDPEVQHELEMALKIMGEYEETLRILAK